MTQELQHLLTRIREEGVDKANAEADTILAQAKTQASEILAKARTEADTLRQDAERDAAAFEQRARESLQQAARDVRLQLQQDLTQTIETLLRKAVDATAADATSLQGWISSAVSAFISDSQADLEVVLGGDAAKLADSLTAQLQAQAAAPSGLRVNASPAFPNGFTLKLEGGRVEQSFTSEAITAALARLLRPQLAQLLQGS